MSAAVAAPAGLDRGSSPLSGDLGRGRRLVLAIGVNRGAKSETPLEYAEQDAEMFIDVMQDVGGVTTRNAITLLGTTAGLVEDELDRIAGRLVREQWGGDDFLAVYVSSHAADGELHFDGTRLPMRVLRDFVFNAPVGTAILVLDTCQAADVSRTKGLVAIDGPVLELETPPVAGRVILASSGPTEYSHESSSVSGSYFTHHLVAGLRGAADVSGDRIVTLQEAFSYAYTRTLESTTASRGGRQTPRYELELSGERDLVLTSLSRGRAWLSIDVERPGDWLVTSVETGRVVANVVKGRGNVVLSIDPGSYRLRTREGGSYLDGEIEVVEGQSRRVDESELNRWGLVAGRVKGGATPEEPDWWLAAGVQMGTPAVDGFGRAIGGGFAIARVVGDGGWLGGRPYYELAVGYRSGQSVDRTEFTEQEGEIAGGAGLRWSTGRARIRVGLRAGGLVIRQREPGVDDRTGLQSRIGGAAGLDVLLNDWLAVEFGASGGTQRVRKQSGHVQVPYVVGAIGVGLGL